MIQVLLLFISWSQISKGVHIWKSIISFLAGKLPLFHYFIDRTSRKTHGLTLEAANTFRGEKHSDD